MPLLTENTLSIAGKKKLEPFRRPDLLKTDVVKLGDHADGTTTYYKRGTVFSQLTPAAVGVAAALSFMPYDNAGTDGTQIATCILQYDIVVSKVASVSQRYWYGNWTTSYPGPHGEFVDSVPMIFGGEFKTSDLYVGAGTAEDTAVRLDSTNTYNMVDTLAALVDWNATTIMQTQVGNGSTIPSVYIFRF